MAQKRIRRIKVWFDKVLPKPRTGGNLPLAQRKANAKARFEQTLAASVRGDRWDIFHIFWEVHDQSQQLLRATVLIKRKPRIPGGPGGDSKIPPPPAAPPTSA